MLQPESETTPRCPECGTPLEPASAEDPGWVCPACWFSDRGQDED